MDDNRVIVVIAIVLIILGYSWLIEPNSLNVTEYKIKNSYLTGAKIVFLSDFHFRKNSIHDRKRLNKIVKLTEEQKPNLILLGGDYLQGKDYDSTLITTMAAKLSLVGAPVFAVLGDEDLVNETKHSKIKQALLINGIKVLDNTNKRTVLNGRYVDIVGISDAKKGKPNIDRAMFRTLKLRIILTHNPDIYYNIIDDVVLIFAGHTHGGQFILPFAQPLFVDSKFGAQLASGLISDSQHNKMIVSKGIGTTGIPLRLNCKPEIVVVEFTN